MNKIKIRCKKCRMEIMIISNYSPLEVEKFGLSIQKNRLCSKCEKVKLKKQIISLIEKL